MITKSSNHYREKLENDCKTISDFDREQIMRAYYRYDGNPRLAAKGLPYGPRRIKNVWLAAGLEIRHNLDYKGVIPGQNSRGGLERKL